MNPNEKALQTAKITKVDLLSFSSLIFDRRFTNSKANSYSPLLGNDLGPLGMKSDLLTIRPRIFQIVLRGGGIFLLGGWNQRRSDFEHSNLFES